jgi:hypothetical protein
LCNAASSGISATAQRHQQQAQVGLGGGEIGPQRDGLLQPGDRLVTRAPPCCGNAVLEELVGLGGDCSVSGDGGSVGVLQRRHERRGVVWVGLGRGRASGAPQGVEHRHPVEWAVVQFAITPASPSGGNSLLRTAYRVAS